MKQTAKRILSLVLSLLMLVSMMTVYTSAANNYVPDEEYYDRIMLDSVVVNPEWVGLEAGDQLTYEFRGKEVTETYDANIHFSTIQAAFDASVKAGNKNPVIVLTPGDYSDPVVITDSVTIVGPNGGINPVVKGAHEEDAWTENSKRGEEARLTAAIFVKRTIKNDLEIRFDGVTLYKGFSFMDAGSREADSIVYCVNTVINGAGAGAYDNYTSTDVFSFANATNVETTVNLTDSVVKNLKTTNVVGVGATNLNVDGVLFTLNNGGLIGNGDGALNQEPNYVIKNTMFYNNSSNLGVVSIDYSKNDNATRTKTSLEIADCWFIDGPDTVISEESVEISPIYLTLVGPKNEINIHDNYFEGKTDYNAAVLNLGLSSSALSQQFISSIKFNNNKFIGYINLPDTGNMTSDSTVDFNGNYFATADFMQADPVYTTESCYNNVKVDYFYVNEDLTIPSTDFTMKSFGIPGAKIDDQLKEITATVDFNEKIKINMTANSDSTTFTLYSDAALTKKVTTLDTSTLESGVDKNVFYAVAKSTKYPSYTYKYTVYLTTFDPDQTVEFNKANTYMLTDDVADMKKGETYFNTWDGVAYRFVVGTNVFSDIKDVYAVCKGVPTVIIPAGVYSTPIYVVRSTVILGAKHGINPNIPNFDNPDSEWDINEQRSQADEETVLQNAAIAVETTETNTNVTVDGITFGIGSGYADRESKANFYTTSNIENCIIDGAGGAKYLVTATGVTTTIPTVINIGSSAGSSDSATHKSLNLVNLRMVAQPVYQLLGSYFENLVIDGCYVANNTGTLLANEVSAPKDQNFDFTIRNSCFYKNITTNYYFIVNNNATASTTREYSNFIVENSIFYETNSNVNGIFGVRFQGATDYVEFRGNTFVSSTATALIPGYENWFLGNSGYKSAAAGTVDPLSLQPLTTENFVVKNNRMIGSKINSTTPNTSLTHPNTHLDFSQNYFATSLGKTVTGSKPTLTDTKRHTCDTYYSDWNMTNLVGEDENYGKELVYEFYGANTANKTFAATVSATTDKYTFDYDVETFQAKVSIYSDKNHKNEVTNPVPLKGGKNVFYIVFSSNDGTVKDEYTATVTKPASKDANVLRFGNWKIQDKNIFASVDVGTTTFAVPEIEVSVGATYGIYNDAACTKAFTASKITGISTVPTAKYIKVVSEDGKTTNIYKLSIIQAQNDQAEVVAIEGATKTSATVFTANTVSAIFDIYADISYGATMRVLDGKAELKTNADGSITVDGVVTSKKITIEVTSQTGVKNTFTLNIVRGSSSADIEGIRFMINNGGDKSEYEFVADNVLFEVVPTLASEGATFALYNDRACTDSIDGTTLVLKKRFTTVYMKVTSADGTATNVVKLNVRCVLYKADEEAVDETIYVIKDATLNEDSNERYTIKTKANATKFTLVVEPKSETYAATSYAVYADADYSYKIGAEVAIGTPVEVDLVGSNTTLYIRVYARAGEKSLGTKYPAVTVFSARPSVTYKDQSKIAAWAKDEVEFLNKNGYAYFVGDEKGNFNPTAGISRYEVAVVVSKVLGVNPTYYKSAKSPFVADNIPAWANPYVVAVYKLGIMSGKSATSFDGAAQTTRQEFARIIAGTIAAARGETGTIDEIYTENQTLIDYDYNQYTFADEKEIASWAASAVKLSVSYYKVMSGSADNGKLYINPKKAITRQEVAVLIANFSGYTGE